LTQDIRADDAKGRHTTTARELVRARSGGWIIDTPGMRALRIADAQDGIGAVFADLEDLAAACRFSDCAHDGEPGCAVGAAIEAGDLDPARLTRWRKLVREDERHTQTLADARARDRELGKVYRNAKAARRFRRDD
jgi:ribosome biogenesis GTPase